MATGRAHVARWLAAYIEAWKSYDPEAIGELFSEACVYRYHPYDEPIRGRAAVVESWLGEGEHEDASSRDPEGTYDAEYRPVAVEGDTAVAAGTSSYSSEPGGRVERIFDNCFLLRFEEDGRCAEFTEWFIERPTDPDA